MSRIEFDTGVRGKHQKPMIRWVRSRLADQKGKVIKDPQSSDKWKQYGVLIADGVGMGMNGLEGARMVINESIISDSLAGCL
jgi:hypothetical protein